MTTSDRTAMTNYKNRQPLTSWHAAPPVGPLETGVGRARCTPQQAEQRITDPFPPPGRALTCDDARPANGLLTLGGR